MINEDSTGDPGTAAAPLFDRCLPSRRTGREHQAGQPGGGRPDRAVRRQLPVAVGPPDVRALEIVAQGDQTDLGASHALEACRPGKYLISVTADGFKIDGAHFTVDARARRAASTRRDAPTAAAAGDHQDPGLQRQRPGRRHLRGRRRAGPRRLHRAPHRRPRRGQHRLLRQRRCAPSTSTTATDRTRCCSAPTASPSSTRRARPASAPATRSGVIMIPNLGPNRYAATVTPPAGAVAAGSRRPPSRAATTTTSGSRRATPASTPSSSRAAEPVAGDPVRLRPRPRR